MINLQYLGDSIDEENGFTKIRITDNKKEKIMKFKNSLIGIQVLLKDRMFV